jgi:soluble lytic murein transglycosylase-like protein
MPSILPDATALGERPSLQPSMGVAQYEPPNPRFAGLAGQIVQGAGNELQQAGDIIAQTNQKYDAISAKAAINQLQTAKANLEFDPKTGFTQARGANATGQEFNQTYTQKFDDAVSQISDGLQNNQQKQLFQQESQILAGQYQSSLLQHQAKQTVQSANDTYTDTIKNAISNAASHPFDQTVSDVATNDMNNAMAGHFSLNGYTSSMADAERAKNASALLSARTQGMMLDPNNGPVKAAAFFHDHELEFDPATRNDLGRQLKTTNDAITARIDGEAAYKSVTAPAPVAALPQNFNAPKVSAYDQKAIDQRVAAIKAPSQYDAIINEAATTWGVSPTELKLRMAAESGGNPNAVSSQGAIGLMQFMPDTAKALGVTDPTDPRQAIFGAAKLIAQAGGTVGGDMSKVDRVYYSGSAIAKPGTPNTDQYVANLAAVRNQLYGAAAAPLSTADLRGKEGAIIDAAKANAEATHPGDLGYQQQAIAEARKPWAQDLQVKESTDYANKSQILGLSIGPSGAKSLSDLPAAQQAIFSQLPPQDQHMFLNLWQSNQGEDKITPTPDTDKKTLALLGQAINDPVAFKSLDIVGATQGLPRTNQNQAYAAWMSIDKNMAKGANIEKAIALMRPDMEAAKIKLPSPAEKGSLSSYTDYNAFTSLLSSGVQDFQDQHKRSPTQQEIQAIGRPLLAQVNVPHSLWFDGSQMALKSVEMTPDDQSALSGALTRKYGYTPSAEQVQQAKAISVLHPNDAGIKAAFHAKMLAGQQRVTP